MRKITKIFVHCSAGFGGVSVMRQHWKSMGWKNDGYHVVIDIDGHINYLNNYNVVTNGVINHNANSIHICYVGGVLRGSLKASDTRTPEQKESLLKVLTELKECFPDAQILGHRDISPDMNGDGIIQSFEWIKECPSFDAIEEYKHI